MCGASLDEEAEPEPVEETKRRIPGWVGSVAVAVLALAILGAGGFGLYSMLAAEPEPEPTAVPVTPTTASTPTPSPTPTETPVPTATPTPVPPRAHHVQEGETISDIAELYGVTIDEVLALNPEVDPELINPGQVVLIPADEPAAGALIAGETEDPESTQAGFVVHVVSSGETLSSIAVDYGVSVSAIRAANDLSPDDETIRAEQSLVIPMNTPTPSPTPTPDLNTTPTASPLYASPPLLNPPDGAVLTGGSPVLLQWASVSVLEDNEWYELSLWQPAGGVVSNTVRIRATAWRVPLDLMAEAEGEAPEFLWRVQVVRETAEQVHEKAGAPSEVRGFVWKGATPTRPPNATSTP